MRAILLFGVLALLVAGAFLWHQMRFSGAQDGGRDSSAVRNAAPGEVVFELGGPAARSNKSTGDDAPSPRRGAVAQAAEKAPPPSETAENEAIPQPAKTQSSAPSAEPVDAKKNAPAVKIEKGNTIYKVALKYYGSGAPDVIHDIASANRIADAAKVREGTSLVLPETAGGRRRR